MGLKDNLNSILDAHSKSIASVYSFTELCESKIRDVENWLTGDDGVKISLALPISDSATSVCYISKQQYDAAMEDETTQFQVYDQANHLIMVTGQQILDAVDDNIITLQSQKSYINYMLQAGEVKTVEVVSFLKNTVVGITSNKIDWFVNLCAGCASPIDAITNFFSSFKTDKATISDTYVGWAWNSAYRGNAYEAAVVQIGSDLQGLCDAVIDALCHIEEFGERICRGLLKFGKIAFGAAFGSLLTIYEKASNAVSGYLDYPLFTYYFHYEYFDQIVTNMSKYSLKTYSWDHKNFQINPDIWIGNGSYLTLIQSFKRLFLESVDGHDYKTVTQVIVPCPNSVFDIMLQVGWQDADTDIMLVSAYLVCNYSSFSKYDDTQIPEKIFNTLKEFVKQMDSVLPWSLTKQNVDDTSIHFQDETEALWKYGNYGVELFDYQVLAKHQCGIYATDVHLARVRSILLYMCVFGKGFYNSSYQEPNQTNSWLMILFNRSWCFYALDPDPEGEASFIDELSPIDDTVFLESFSTNTYRPYNKQFFLAPTVTYQTITARSKEITDLFYKILIIAAVITVTIKVMKWRKNRQQSEYLAWANADKLSWDYAGDPTAENKTKVLKAFKKARKLSFVNGLLGCSSEFAFSAASSSLISQQSISSFSGLSAENSTNATEINRRINIVNKNVTGSNIN